MDTESIHPDVIYTDDHCVDFIDSTHKYSYVYVLFYKSVGFAFGYNLNITLCQELCLPEGKFLLLSFKENVQGGVLFGLAKYTGVINVWLSFDVAAGPNCEDLPKFDKQQVRPYTVAVLGFCEAELGDQQGYTIGNLKNFMDTAEKMDKSGTLHAKLNGNHLDLSDKELNWGSVFFKADKAIVYRSVTNWRRNNILNILAANNSVVIWHDVGAGSVIAISRRVSFLCMLLSIVKIA